MDRLLTITANQLTFPDGRILARYYKDRQKWELLIWRDQDYKGSLALSISDEDRILDEALFNGCMIDCLECEKARQKGLDC